MESWPIALMVAMMTIAFTLIVMLDYGVNARNYSLFVKILRLKIRRADATDFGNAIYNYVIAEVNRRGENWNGKYDIRPAIELIGECDFDDAYIVVVRQLLDAGFRPVSLDKGSRILLLG